ncbi:hypothetical protein V1511DRAFT_519610 [Dipodascopsis uninucleata]
MTSTIEESNLVYLEPSRIRLNSGEKATLYAFHRLESSSEQDSWLAICDASGIRPISNDSADALCRYMFEEFNSEIDRGQTYPHLDKLTYKQFKDYWFYQFAVIGVIDCDQEPPVGDFFNSPDFDIDSRYIGTFYIKSNYIGRCDHVCNAGFLVSSSKRGEGIGSQLGKQYIQWAPKLGYKSSVFNLVFETNIASQRIWEGLGFEKIGRIKKVARLKGYEERGLVDAFMYGYDFEV